MPLTPAEIHPTLSLTAGKVNGNQVGLAADHQAPGWATGAPPGPVSPPGPNAVRIAGGHRLPEFLTLADRRARVEEDRKAAAKAKLDADLAEDVRRAAWMRRGFYIVVLVVAMAGQVTGAVDALHLPLIAVMPAVAALELGGIVVMANADVRRRLGERATASRLLSAGIAAWAVAFNWLAHTNHLLGGFYAGMSALGYLVWLMHTENQRRDRLRALGDLPPTTPAYEFWGHWLTHPLLTRRARSLAKQYGLNLYASLERSAFERARGKRTRAIAKVLRQEIRRNADSAAAEIGLSVYDMDEVAVRLAADADYAHLTSLVAARVHPNALLSGASAERTQARPDLQERAVSSAPMDALSDAVSSAPAIAPQTHLTAPVERTSERASDAVPSALPSAPSSAVADAVEAHPTDTPSSAPETHPIEVVSDAPETRSQTQRRTQSGRTAKRTPDAAALRKLSALAKRTDGTVSVRKVMSELSVGATKAKEYLKAAGLPPYDDTENGAQQ